MTRSRLEFLEGASRHTKILESKGPSQGVIQDTSFYERSLCAPKFADRPREDLLTHERCARRKAWDGSKCPQAQGKGQGHVHLPHRSMGLQKFGYFRSHSGIGKTWLRDLPEWVGGVHRKPGRQKEGASNKGHPRKLFLGFRFGTSYQGCKGNVSCTSYSRTFGYGILT